MVYTTLFQVWGRVTAPDSISKFGDVDQGGIGRLLNILLNALVLIAGIYALFNFVLAGYSFMSAGGDSRKVADAWAKIWQSVIGLVVATGSLVLAAIFGELLFDDPLFLINPSIPTP